MMSCLTNASWRNVTLDLKDRRSWFIFDRKSGSTKQVFRTRGCHEFGRHCVDTDWACGKRSDAPELSRLLGPNKPGAQLGVASRGSPYAEL
jgi:hypothetical protein